MEVAGTTDVAVKYRRPVRGLGGPPAIEVVLQDGFDARVGTRPDAERPTTGRFQPITAVGRDEADNANRSAEALLGMRALTQDDLDQRRRVGPDLAGTPPQVLLCPVGIAP